MQEIKLPPEGKKLAEMNTEELSNVLQMAWEIEEEYIELTDPIHLDCDDVSVSDLCKVRRTTAILQLKLCQMYEVPIGKEHTRFMFEIPKELLEAEGDSAEMYYLWDSAPEFMEDIRDFADFSGIAGFSCEFFDLDEIRDFAELCMADLLDENGEPLDVNSDDAEVVPCLAEAMKDYYPDYSDHILESFAEAYLYSERDDYLMYKEFAVVSSSDVPKVLSVVNAQKSVEQSKEALLYGECLKSLATTSYYRYQNTEEPRVYKGKWQAVNITQMEYAESGESEQGLALSLCNRITATIAGVLAERIQAQVKVEPKSGRNSRRAKNV